MSSAKWQGTTSIYKNQLYFYTLAMNNNLKIKLRKKNSFTTASKRIKRLTNIVQDLHTENYKTLLKEIKLKATSCLCVEGLTIKIAIVSKSIYRSKSQLTFLQKLTS